MAEPGEERIRQIEDLVRRLEAIPDDSSRELAHSLMGAILELHGRALERLLELVLDSGDAGKAAVRRMAGDSLVASVLVLHDLHPDDIETRVHRALGKMYGNAELLGVFEGRVRIRITGSGCGLKQSVETAVREAVPDAVEIVIEDALPVNNFVSLESLTVPAGGV